MNVCVCVVHVPHTQIHTKEKTAYIKVAPIHTKGEKKKTIKVAQNGETDTLAAQAYVIHYNISKFVFVTGWNTCPPRGEGKKITMPSSQT